MGPLQAAAAVAGPEAVALPEADLARGVSAALAEGRPCSISRPHGATRLTSRRWAGTSLTTSTWRRLWAFCNHPSLEHQTHWRAASFPHPPPIEASIYRSRSIFKAFKE
jgi:hypothetical protein